MQFLWVICSHVNLAKNGDMCENYGSVVGLFELMCKCNYETILCVHLDYNASLATLAGSTYSNRT